MSTLIYIFPDNIVRITTTDHWNRASSNGNESYLYLGLLISPQQRIKDDYRIRRSKDKLSYGLYNGLLQMFSNSFQKYRFAYFSNIHHSCIIEIVLHLIAIAWQSINKSLQNEREHEFNCLTVLVFSWILERVFYAELSISKIYLTLYFVIRQFFVLLCKGCNGRKLYSKEPAHAVLEKI